jgi:hypothetical protein
VIRPPASRDRPHGTPPRVHQIYVRCSPTEYDAIRAAAISAGLTPGGYAAEAALAAARASTPVTRPEREVLLELITTRAQLRRYGTNLNQAARILNAGGDPPEWLKSAVALTDRLVERIDRATQNLLDPPRRRA